MRRFLAHKHARLARLPVKLSPKIKIAAHKAAHPLRYFSLYIQNIKSPGVNWTFPPNYISIQLNHLPKLSLAPHLTRNFPFRE
jgi:hypothetical protein